jgi:predicted DNA-binding protein (UPF0251 family)
VEKSVPKPLKIFAALLLAALVVVFVIKAHRYLSDRGRQETTSTQIPATGDVDAKAPITIELLEALDWQDFKELTQKFGTDAGKIRQILQTTSGLQNSVAVYLRGFLLMIDNKPQRALDTFDRLSAGDIPGPFLYTPYRLQRQMRPLEFNKYLAPLREAIAAGELSPLIKARVQAQEGDPYSAISSYMQTDPAQWVLYDIECLKKIGLNSGLHSEVRRVIAGALKSRRVSGKIADELRQLAALEPSESEVRALKRQLKEELIQDSSAAKIAVSSMARLLETRQQFLQRDYKTILAQYKNANPIALPTESVLVLFLSAVELDDRLEMDRWGQEIKRRHPTQEVINWISELKTSAK